ncbi:MAG: AGCS family alanine or glycine:cation symporter, partial [Parvicellaceae bacterium]
MKLTDHSYKHSSSIKSVIVIVIMSLFVFSVSTTGYSQEDEDEEQGLGEKIDVQFGNYTGWFVDGIFASIPIGTSDTTFELNLIDSVAAGYTRVVLGDSITFSEFGVKGRIGEELKGDLGSARITGGSFIIAKMDADKLGQVSVLASAPSYKIPWVLIVLVAAALYFTFYFKLINVTGFFTAIGVVRGKYDDLEEHGEHPEASDSVSTVDGDNPDTIRIEGIEGEGEVSHFQALTAALSATVGLGNIAGVAVAISIGGPGATFWMIIAGLIGMATKFVECTLGVKYREVDENGVIYGGPMYYL